jgi:uncharacterized protein
MPARSIKGVAQRAVREDKKLRAQITKDRENYLKAAMKGSKDSKNYLADGVTKDSFVNFTQALGIGADNPLTTAGYGFNPITRIRNTLDWIHRGSWLGGVAIDLVADDMTRAGAELTGELKPDKIDAINESAVSLGIWNSINETIKWARLYGGCLAVMMIDGQDWATPLNLDRVGKGQFKGLLVLDRWMVDPSLENLVTETGPDIGLPKFYRVTADAPALPRVKIHYSRCIRLEGIRLPYYQRLQENLWGISILERLYDRMVAFDSATTGAAQLVYKAYIRTYKIKGLRNIVSQGGQALQGLIRYVDMMRRFQSLEGMTLLDGEDEFEGHQHSAFSGLSEALVQFGQQLSGALQIPLVRLFGQSPAGLNATGESDLRTYYDGIKQQQVKTLKVPMTKVYRCIAQSEGIRLPDGFGADFRTLWELTSDQKADVTGKITGAVVEAHEAGLISAKTSLRELKQSSKDTGVFSNIEESDINSAEDEPPPPAAELAIPGQPKIPGAPGAAAKPNGKANGKQGEAVKQERGEGKGKPNGKTSKTRDSVAAVAAMKRIHGIDIVVENRESTHRSSDHDFPQPADYGYILGTLGDDGENLDCYIGPDYESDQVVIVRQQNPETQQYDERKVLFAYNTLPHAMFDYFAAYPDGSAAARIQGFDVMTMDEFKAWRASQPRSGDMSVHIAPH